MAMATESNQKKFSNWLQCVQALEDKKKALHVHVFELWMKNLMTWTEGERAAIPTFIKCVWNKKLIWRGRKWQTECGHTPCATILSHLLKVQQNPGPKVVWESKLCDRIINEGMDEMIEDTEHADNSQNILRIATTMLHLFLRMLFLPLMFLKSSENISHHVDIDCNDIFEGYRKEHVWCIANMFMHRGNAKLNISNTGPDDTDAAMFFRMMKNCKLFEIEDENYLYDDVLQCRDRLHHSVNNRIDRVEAERYLGDLKSFLAKYGDVPECQTAIDNIERMRQETILAVSVPNDNLLEMAKSAFALKISALKVDEKTNEDNGYNNEDTAVSIEETESELNDAYNPELPLNQLKSKAELKQECVTNKETIDKLREQLKEKEDENILLHNQIKDKEDEQSFQSRHQVERQDMFEIPPSDQRYLNNTQEPVANKETEPQSSEGQASQHQDVEGDCVNTVGDNQRGQHAGSRTAEKEAKDGKRQFEIKTMILKSSFDNPDIAEEDRQWMNLKMDEVIERLSKTDPSFLEKAETFVEQENLRQETLKLVTSRTSQTEQLQEAGNFSDRKSVQAGATDTVPSTSLLSVWSVASKTTYSIKVEGDSYPCNVWSCCQLPSSEIILADGKNKKLKKLNAEYKAIGVCGIDDEPCDVCYLGNNKAVISLLTRQLSFIDVKKMKWIGSVSTNPMCRGLACLGDKLYAADYNNIYLFSTSGKFQRVLFTIDADAGVKQHIAVSDDGSKLYVTGWKEKLITLDSDGNHLYTLTDPELSGPCGVCVGKAMS